MSRRKNPKPEPAFDVDGLGARLAYARERRKMSQRELGEAANVDNAQISLIERGLQPGVGLDIVVRLAKCLRVSLDWLLFEVGRIDSEAAHPLPFARRESDGVAS